MDSETYESISQEEELAQEAMDCGHAPLWEDNYSEICRCLLFRIRKKGIYPDEREDMLHEGILQAVGKRACCKYDPKRGSFVDIAVHIAYQEFLNSMRKKTRREKIFEDVLYELPQGVERGFEWEKDVITLMDVWSGLEALPERHRKAVVVSALGYGQKEAADLLGISQKQFDNASSKGRTRLRRNSGS